MDWREYIHRDPAILSGKAVIKGTRISVQLILERLSGEWDVEDLLEGYPHINRQQIAACLAYAADMAGSIMSVSQEIRV